MRRLDTFTIAAALLGSTMLGMAGAAQAAPIVAGSALNFAGQSSCSTTTCTFGSAIVTSGSLAFSGFTYGTVATFFPMTYNPFTPQLIYSTTNALGQTATFSVTSQLSQTTIPSGGLTNFVVTDRGVATLTGFEPTPGVFTFTANQDGTTIGSFSATALVTGAVPEPMTWAMMVAGFASVGFAMRRRGRMVVRTSYAV